MNNIIKNISTENKEKLDKMFLDKNIAFLFFPNSQLREMVVKNEHPIIAKLPKVAKEVLLDGRALIISNAIVKKYVYGKLDEDNNFILSKGEIRVAENNSILNNITI